MTEQAVHDRVAAAEGDIDRYFDNELKIAGLYRPALFQQPRSIKTIERRCDYDQASLRAIDSGVIEGARIKNGQYVAQNPDDPRNKPAADDLAALTDWYKANHEHEVVRCLEKTWAERDRETILPICVSNSIADLIFIGTLSSEEILNSITNQIAHGTLISHRGETTIVDQDTFTPPPVPRLTRTHE